MRNIEDQVQAMVRRYRADLRDIDRKIRDLPAREQALARVHMNVKTACADELQRLLDATGYRASGRNG